MRGDEGGAATGECKKNPHLLGEEGEAPEVSLSERSIMCPRGGLQKAKGWGESHSHGGGVLPFPVPDFSASVTPLEPPHGKEGFRCHGKLKFFLSN